MDIERLHEFLQLYRTGSISRAADLLGISQPMLSRRLRQLESELDLQLFHRTGRGVSATEAANNLFIHAAEIVERHRQALADLQATCRDFYGSVSVGIGAAVGDVLTVPIVERFRRQFPKVRLRLVEGGSGVLLRLLHEERLDAAVLYVNPGMRTLIVDQVGEVICGLVGRPDQLGAFGHREAAAFDNLKGLPLVMPSEPNWLRSSLDEVVRCRNAALTIAVEIDGLAMLIKALLAGLGCAILPRSAVAQEVTAGFLRFLPIRDPTVGIPLSVATGGVSSGALPSKRLGALLRDEVLAAAAAIGLERG